MQQGRRLADPEALVRRIPAEAVEAFVRDRCRRLLRTPDAEWPDLAGLVLRVELQHEQVTVDLALAQLPSSDLEPEAQIARLAGRVDREEHLARHPGDPEQVRLCAAVRLKRRGGRTRISTPSGAAPPAVRCSPTLVKALRRATEIAHQHHMLARRSCEAPPTRPASFYERKLVVLAFLAPDIQAAILAGSQPGDLTLERLMRPDVPLAWPDQRRALGFPDRA